MSYGSTGDNWLQDRDKLLSLVNEISKDIQERNKQLRNGQKSAQKNTQIRNSINNLGKEIIKLDDTLNKIARNPQTYNITDNELSRRRDMVNNLRNKKDELAAVLSQGDSVAQESGKNPNRDSLLGSGEKKPGSRAFGPAAAKETEETLGHEDEDILQMQQSKIKDQDDLLDALHDSVTKQKQLGYAIHDELGLQSRLLDDIEHDVDKVTNKTKNANNALTKLSKKAKTGGAICIVVILIIILILLLVFRDKLHF